MVYFLRSRTLTLCLRHAFEVCFFMFILCHAAKNEPMKIDFGLPKSASIPPLLGARQEVASKNKPLSARGGAQYERP